MLAFSKNTQSTHAPEVQASMGSLILLLRKCYLSKLEDHSKDQDPTDNIRATTIVTNYLTKNASEGPHELTSFVNFINGHYPEEEARTLHSKLQEILHQHPEIPDSHWTTNDERWAINQVYDATKNATKEISASPAETLLLVLLAIFDNTRLAQENQHDVMKNLADALLNIVKQENEGQFRICSGGRQHEILFVLNQAWKNDAGELIRIVEVTADFILESVRTFRNNHFLTQPVDVEFHLIIEMLKNRNTATYQTIMINQAWKDACLAFVNKRFQEIGLDFQKHQQQCEEFIQYITEDDVLPNTGRLPTTVIETIFRASCESVKSFV